MRRNVRVLFAVLVYVVVANVPLWLASRFLDFSVIGLFNIEFVTIGILSLYAGRRLGVCLLLSAIILDLIYSIGKTYLLTPVELFASASSGLLYLPSHIWSLTAVAFATLAVCLLAAMTGSDEADRTGRRRTVYVLAGIALLGLAVDGSRGEIAAFRADSQGGELRMVRNTVHRMVLDEERLRREKRRISAGTATSMRGASMRLMEMKSTAATPPVDWSGRPNVVFVVVESWGKPVSGEMDRSLMGPYLREELGNSYTVSTGTVPFQGATVSGELRELCSSPLGLAVMAAPASRLQGCLAERFERLGYHTIAVHGFEGAMFERSSWYRKLGFEETWFRKQLKEKGLPDCVGAFPGICDAAISSWIDGRLQAAGKDPQLVYWLTLNSHLPVPVSNDVKDPPSCSGVAELADEAVCAWYRLIFNVHRSVAELAVRQIEHPTVFIVVGDHAPPFSSERRRKEFSSEVVPYVMLWPKNVRGEASRPPVSVAAGHTPLHLHPRAPSREGTTVSHFHGSGL